MKKLLYIFFFISLTLISSTTYANSQNSFINELTSLLPTPLQTYWQNPPTIKRGTIDDFDPIDFENCNSDSHRFNNWMRLQHFKPWWGPRNNPRRIVLNPQIYDILEQGYNVEDSSCLHETQYEYALGAFIYLTGYIYDRVTLTQQEQHYLKNECSSDFPNKACRHLKIKRSRISDSLQFKRLNFHNQASPHINLDRRQWDRQWSAFAVNLEYLLLDPKYPCRRPAMARFLNQKLQRKHLTTCLMDSRVTVEITDEKVDLSPSRLTQVNFVLVPKGNELISRWGHAMFELVYGENKYYLSYYAFSDNNQDYLLSGFNNSMFAQLNVYNWQERNLRYSQESRQLETTPLLLSKEKLLFLGEHIFESIKYEQGRWNHLKSNCATNGLELIQAIMEDLDFNAKEIMTPKGFKRLLKKSHLISN